MDEAETDKQDRDTTSMFAAHNLRLTLKRLGFIQINFETLHKSGLSGLTELHFQLWTWFRFILWVGGTVTVCNLWTFVSFSNTVEVAPYSIKSAFSVSVVYKYMKIKNRRRYGKTNRLFPFDIWTAQKKTRQAILLLSRIRCRGNIFTESLSSNESPLWLRYSGFHTSCHNMTSFLFNTPMHNTRPLTLSS